MIYKQASYEGKGRNPFYYMSYIDPEWFFEDKIIIHPDCKEILDSICDDFVDIKTIVFPVGLIKIGDKAFRGCSDLKKIVLKEGLKHLGNRAFEGCYQVTRIELPSSLKSIGEGCFANIDNLSTIIYHGTVEEWNKVKKGKDWMYGDDEIVVKCNDGKIRMSSKVRYCYSGDKDNFVNKELVRDEIKEISSLPMKDRIKRAKEIYDSFNRYLSNRNGFSEEEKKTILLGIPKMFISSSGGFRQIHFKRFQEIFDLDISFKEFKRTMTNSFKLEEKAFDLITCRMHATKRLNIVVIGAALVCENKSITWNTHRLINEIMGPLGK